MAPPSGNASRPGRALAVLAALIVVLLLAILGSDRQPRELVQELPGAPGPGPDQRHDRGAAGGQARAVQADGDRHAAGQQIMENRVNASGTSPRPRSSSRAATSSTCRCPARARSRWSTWSARPPSCSSARCCWPRRTLGRGRPRPPRQPDPAFPAPRRAHRHQLLGHPQRLRPARDARQAGANRTAELASSASRLGAAAHAPARGQPIAVGQRRGLVRAGTPRTPSPVPTARSTARPPGSRPGRRLPGQRPRQGAVQQGQLCQQGLGAGRSATATAMEQPEASRPCPAA